MSKRAQNGGARALSSHFENFLFTVGLLLKKCSRCSIWDCFPSRHKLLRVTRRMEKKRMDKIIYSVLYYTIIPVFLLGCLCCCTPHSPSVRPFFLLLGYVSTHVIHIYKTGKRLLRSLAGWPQPSSYHQTGRQEK